MLRRGFVLYVSCLFFRLKKQIKVHRGILFAGNSVVISVGLNYFQAYQYESKSVGYETVELNYKFRHVDSPLPYNITIIICYFIHENSEVRHINVYVFTQVIVVDRFVALFFVICTRT